MHTQRICTDEVNQITEWVPSAASLVRPIFSGSSADDEVPFGLRDPGKLTQHVNAKNLPIYDRQLSHMQTAILKKYYVLPGRYWTDK